METLPFLSSDWALNVRIVSAALACAGQLGLALLVGFSPRRGSGGNTFVLLALSLFAWGFFGLAYVRTGVRAWHFLETASSPWALPLAMRFLLVFTGRLRAFRKVSAGAFAYFGVLSVWPLGALLEPSLLTGPPELWWSSLMLVGIVPLAAFSARLLWLHLHRSASPQERLRTRILLGSLILAVSLSGIEILSGLGLRTPPLASLGALCATLGMGATALRLHLLAPNPSRKLAAGAVAAAALGFMSFFALTLFLGTRLAASGVVLGTVGVGVLALGARWLEEQSQRRERLSGLVSMGRMAGQLAHDLKNPLAALKGSVQLLQGGVSPEEAAQLHTLMIDQVDRLTSVIETYRRLGKVEPNCASVALNELAQKTLALRQAAPPPNVELLFESAPVVPPCPLDRELVAAALDNLVQNALEAMPDGGRLVLRTGYTGEAVFLEVQDGGRGMDPRTAERAFDDFFTTKAKGSGLGLAFVRRVAVAHGGEAALSSEEGSGTIVRMSFPLSGPDGPA